MFCQFTLGVFQNTGSHLVNQDHDFSIPDLAVWDEK